MKDIKKLLQFINYDTTEAIKYLANENLEMVFRLCEMVIEQATEIHQLIKKLEEEKGE